MKKTIYIAEYGNDKNDGLSEKTPVRTPAQAIMLEIKTGGQEIRVLGSGYALSRLNVELETDRKKSA